MVTLRPGDYRVAVCGLMLHSEHEESCYCTVELITDPPANDGADVHGVDRCARAGAGVTGAIAEALLEGTRVKAKGGGFSKGSVPDYVCFGEVPRNFKGAIQVTIII